jgi:hypothetical protein
MKRILLYLALCVSLQTTAQSQQTTTVRDAFKAMPDSLLPYLTTNNRLDMMDFMDAKMKSVVTNLLDGQTEMLYLTDDSLAVALNKSVLMQMWLEPVDTGRVVCVRKVYHAGERQRQVVEERYTMDWRVLSGKVVESTLLRRDEEIKEKSHL